MSLDAARRLLQPSASNRLSLLAGSVGDPGINAFLRALGGTLTLAEVVYAEDASSASVTAVPADASALQRTIPGGHLQIDTVKVKAVAQADALTWSLAVGATLANSGASLTIALAGQADSEGVLRFSLAGDVAAPVELSSIGELIDEQATVATLQGVLESIAAASLASVELSLECTQGDLGLAITSASLGDHELGGVALDDLRLTAELQSSQRIWTATHTSVGLQATATIGGRALDVSVRVSPSGAIASSIEVGQGPPLELADVLRLLPGGDALADTAQASLDMLGLRQLALVGVEFSLNPTTRDMSVRVRGALALTIGQSSFAFDTFVWAPNLVVGAELAAGSTIGVRSLVASVAGDTVAQLFPDASITALSVTGFLEHDTLRFSTSIADVFALEVAGFELRAELLNIELTRVFGANAMTDARFNGRLRLGGDANGGGLVVDLSAYPSGPGWRLDGRAALGSGDPMDADAALSSVLARLGVDIVMPPIDEVLDLELTAIEVSIDTGARRYTVAAGVALDLHLFGRDLLALTDTHVAITMQSANGSTPAQKFLDVEGQLHALGTAADFRIHIEEGAAEGQFTIRDLRLGPMLQWFVELVRPDIELDLPSPWDELLAVDLGDVRLTFDLARNTITCIYERTSNGQREALVDLGGLIEVYGFTLTYQRRGKSVGGQPAVPARSGVRFQLDAKFNPVIFGDRFDDELGWDLVNQSPPAVAPGIGVFDLRLLALGQHVGFRNPRQFNHVRDVTTALRGAFAPNESTDPAAAAQNPLTQSTALVFREDSSWLIGASFDLLRFISLDAIWNDPDLYGLRIALSGAMAKSFAGLEFEILYKKITDEIGLFHVELVLPAAFRQLQFGAVSITLPAIVVDIYTNGDFKLDLGFPYGGDFRRSFALQLFPFVGYGGFYFGKLSGATSNRLPAVTHGRFTTVIEAGIGLSVGLGKTIEKGPLSAGATLTLDAIIEGVISWWEPEPGADKVLYYRVDGFARLVGRLWGTVDFKIVSASFSVVAYASITLRLEVYQPIRVEMNVGVTVSASIKIAFVRIRFSFSTRISHSFSIGSGSTPPWALPPSPSLRAGANTRRLELNGSGEAAALPELDPVTVPVQLIVMYTRDSSSPGDNGPARARGIALLSIRTGRDPDATGPDDVSARPFQLLASRVLRQLLKTQWITRAQLDALAEQLRSAAPLDDELAALAQLMIDQHLTLAIEAPAQPKSPDASLDAAVFPIPPMLTLTVGDKAIRLSEQSPVPDDYLLETRSAWQQATVPVGDDPDPHGSGSGSFPELVYRDWFRLIARGLVDRCLDALDEYEHTVEPLNPARPEDSGSRSIVQLLEAEPWGPRDDLDTALVAFFTANRERPNLLRALGSIQLGTLADPIRVDIQSGDTFASLCDRTGLTLSQLAHSGLAELDNLLVAGAVVVLPDLAAAASQALIDRVIASGSYPSPAEQVAGLASRMLMHGLRLPYPEQGPWSGLYDLLGQEFALPDDGELTVSLSPTDADAPPSWLRFADADKKQTRVKLSATELARARAIASAPLDPVSGLELLPVLEYAPVRFALERSTTWQHGDQTSVSLLSLPEALRVRLREPATGAVADGPSLFELVLGYRPRATAPVSWRPPPAFSWAISIDLRVRTIATATGPLRNAYVLLGSDDAGGDRLLRLLRHLDEGHELEPAELWVLVATGEHATAGWRSQPLDAAASFVLKTNPETATVDDDEPLSASFDVSGNQPIVDQRHLLRLLWEMTTSGRGGFVLRYVEQGGAGLPDSVFASGDEGRIRLLIRLRSQRVAAGAAQPPLLPFNDCVLLQGSLDADVDRVAVEACTHVVSAGESTATIAAALGVTVQSLRSANADVVGAFANGEPLAGARLAAAPGLLQALAPVPAGTVGFRLLRDDPTRGSTPQGQLDPDERIDAIFSLLTGNLSSSGAGQAQHFVGPLVDREFRPIGPLVDNPDDLASDQQWRYELAIQPYRSLAPAFASPSEPELPSSQDDPYGGVALGASITFAPAWGDVFGNIIRRASDATLEARLGYSDHLRPLHAWPGCSVHWSVERGATPSSPMLELQLAFDAHPLTLGALALDPSARAAMADDLARAYFQYRAPDVEVWIESSLGATTLDSPIAYPLAPVRVVDLLRGALLVVRELEQTKPTTATVLANDTLASLATRLGVTGSALRTVNPELTDTPDDEPLAVGARVIVPGRIELVDAPANVAPTRITPSNQSNPSIAAVALPSIGANQRTLAELATAHGVELLDLAIVNASLGIIDPARARQALGLSGPQVNEQTLANLFDLLLASNDKATFAGMVDTLATTPALLRVGAHFLLPAPRITLALQLDARTPAPLFPVHVQLVGKRTKSIDPRVAGVDAVSRAITKVPPRSDLLDAASNTTGLRALAARFEAAYQTSAAIDQVARYQGVKLLVGKEPDLGSALWGLRLSATGNAATRYWYAVTQRTPVFYAVKPLATRLLSRRVAVHPYLTGQGIDQVALEDKQLTDIDLDAWARLLLRTIDLTLAPERAIGARRATPAAFDQLVEAKQSLAAAISAGLASVLTHAPGYDATGDLASARAAFEDQLLIQLERAYTIDTLIQVRVATEGPTVDNHPPRLIGALRNVPIVPEPGDTVVEVAARLGVEANFLLALLDDLPKLFAGTPSTPTLASRFAEHMVLPLTAVEYTTRGSNQLETIADFFNLDVEQLELMTGKTAAQLNALAPGSLVRGVDRLPAYTLGSIEIPLGRASAGTSVEYLTSFLDVLREGKDRKAFLDLDYVVTGLRHRIAEVPGVPGVERSSLLEFVLPLDEARIEAEADIGQTEIPLPLRDAPEPPVILRHAALSEPPELEHDFEGFIASLDDWSYRIDSSANLMAQDELRLHVEFGGGADAFADEDEDPEEDQPEPTSDQPSFDDTLFGWLAQFALVLPELERDLAKLPDAAAAADPSDAATPVQALAWLASNTARAWQTWTQPTPTPANRSNGHELHEYRVDTIADAGGEGWLSALRFTSGTSDEAGTFTPTLESLPLFPTNVDVELTGSDPTAPNVRVALAKVEDPTDHPTVEFDYLPAPGQPHLPRPDEVRSHRVEFTQLSVLARSSARSGLRVLRNADLVTTAPIAPAFVYESPLIEAQSFVQPYVRHDDPIELPREHSLAASLARFFRALFRSVPAGTRDVSVRIAYCYELVPDTVLATRVPVLNRTRFGFRVGTDDNPDAPSSFVNEVAAALDVWRAAEQPSASNAHYSFNVVVYDRGENTEFERPVLELTEVRVAVSV